MPSFPHSVMEWVLVANPALMIVVLLRLGQGSAILSDLVRRIERLERLYIK